MDKAQYWECKTQASDNIWKRQAIVKRLLSLELIDQEVLEIGVGSATAASALNIIFLANWVYKGTDVSPGVVDKVRKKQHLDIYQAEVIALPFPDSFFDTVIALDVLEHVPHEERIRGYKEIDRVLKPFGKIALNIPLTLSLHEEYEYGFDVQDMVTLLGVCRMDLETWETYQVRCPGETRAYVWAVGVR